MQVHRVLGACIGGCRTECSQICKFPRYQIERPSQSDCEGLLHVLAPDHAVAGSRMKPAK